MNLEKLTRRNQKQKLGRKEGSKIEQREKRRKNREEEEGKKETELAIEINGSPRKGCSDTNCQEPSFKKKIQGRLVEEEEEGKRRNRGRTGRETEKLEMREKLT